MAFMSMAWCILLTLTALIAGMLVDKTPDQYISTLVYILIIALVMINKVCATIILTLACILYEETSTIKKE